MDKEFIVLVREVHVQPYSVKGVNTKQEALDIVITGGGNILEDEFEYSHSLEPEDWSVKEVKTDEREKGLTFLSTGVCVGCKVCAQSHDFEVNSESAQISWQNGDFVDDPRFSRQPCELCDSSLGGNRYSGHGRDSDDNIVHLEICVDCLQK